MPDEAGKIDVVGSRPGLLIQAPGAPKGTDVRDLTKCPYDLTSNIAVTSLALRTDFGGESDADMAGLAGFMFRRDVQRPIRLSGYSV
jgi:hypothetical protein